MRRKRTSLVLFAGTLKWVILGAVVVAAGGGGGAGGTAWPGTWPQKSSSGVSEKMGSWCWQSLIWPIWSCFTDKTEKSVGISRVHWPGRVFLPLSPGKRLSEFMRSLCVRHTDSRSAPVHVWSSLWDGCRCPSSALPQRLRPGYLTRLPGTVRNFLNTVFHQI